MITAVLLIGILGLLLGLFLGFASKVFHVETDEREEKIIEALPGNNCGGCGYPGCLGLAAAIVKGEGEYKDSDPEDIDEYLAKNIFFVPKNARWSYL